MSGNDCWNRVCFSCCWKANNELADVTLSGSLFQNGAEVTADGWQFERRNLPRDIKSSSHSPSTGGFCVRQKLSHVYRRCYRGEKRCIHLDMTHGSPATDTDRSSPTSRLVPRNVSRVPPERGPTTGSNRLNDTSCQQQRHTGTPTQLSWQWEVEKTRRQKFGKSIYV